MFRELGKVEFSLYGEFYLEFNTTLINLEIGIEVFYLKILMVYPGYPETFWSFKSVLKIISKKAAYPPLGLLTVASLLPPEWEKRLVDLNVKELEDRQIDWADMVFISAMLVQRESTLEVIKRCKEKGKIIVAGGPAFTTEWERYEGVDYFVLNEGEITLPLFLKDLQEGKAEHIYTSTRRPDISQTPVPLWSLINFKDYASLAVQYSRGCPFNCEFCDIIVMNGRIPRTKTPEQLIGEIQSLYDKGWRGPLFIVDDNFIGNKHKVKEMLPSLIQWQKKHKYPLQLFTEASINLSDDEELMEMMSSANFNKVFLGIETPSIESLKECSKYQNATKNLADSVKAIQGHGMQVMGGFIVGFDQDPENIFETQIQFIQEIGVVTAMVGILIALPQTRLWQRLKEEGRLICETSGENTDITLNFIPAMSKELLIEGYKKIVSTIYSPQKYYERIRTFIKNYNPTTKGMITLNDFRAFVKSLWKIGVLSPSRFLYWKLLIETAFTKIKALPVVVELAIFGMHFESVAMRIILSQSEPESG